MALIVANTTNVKEMKNGRPMNVKVPTADLPNCTVVKLVEAGTGVEDHVYTVQVLSVKKDIDDAIAADLAYVMVAPEIMVEQFRKTDGHIGKFRFAKDDVVTAYKLSKHDRLEVSANHPLAAVEDMKVVSTRDMATGLVINPRGALYEGAKIQMKKIEF